MTALRMPIDQPHDPLLARPNHGADRAHLLDVLNKKYEHTQRRLGR